MKNMLGNNDVLRRMWSGPLLTFLERLNGENGEEWETEFNRFLRKEACWSDKKILLPEEPILEFVETIALPIIAVKSVGKDKLKSLKDNRICSYLGSNFAEWFTRPAETSCNSSMNQSLKLHKLRKCAGDNSIIAELGGEANVESCLAEVLVMLENHETGCGKVLLKNSGANIFYVRDSSGTLRTVDASWENNSWSLRANHFGLGLQWNPGYQVFSPNTV